MSGFKNICIPDVSYNDRFDFKCSHMNAIEARVVAASVGNINQWKVEVVECVDRLTFKTIQEMIGSVCECVLKIYTPTGDLHIEFTGNFTCTGWQVDVNGFKNSPLTYTIFFS